MRAVGSRSNLAILGALAALASIPIACAQGTVLSNPGTTGTGGSSSTTTVVSVTSGTGGFGGGGGTSIGGNGGSPSQVSSSSGGPSSMCDGQASLGDCQTCVECANCTLCISQANACLNSEACSSIVDCTGTCATGDQACLQQCLSSNPSGEQAFNAYNLCLGCACQENCQVPASDCQ
jgi:hypothetical protein